MNEASLPNRPSENVLRPTPVSAEAKRVRVPDDMVPALRSDHAGETGAVSIYRGILAVSRNEPVRAFACRHLETEQQHLRLMDEILTSTKRSRLLPAWRVAGWLTGALPALFGPNAVFRTIDAVESFVDRHYADQIDRLRQRPDQRALRRLLERCRSDELVHRDDARTRAGPPSITGRVWAAVVDLGSRAGVYLASRV